MKIENSIGWCDDTINAVTGCDKVSRGCKNCYAEVGTRARVLRAQGKETWGPNGVREPVNFAPVFRRLNNLRVCPVCREAYQQHTEGCSCNGHVNQLRRIRLFADSNSDWLDLKWPVETLAKFLDAIRLAPNVDVQLLTKRIELWRERMLAARNASGTTPEFRYWMDDWYSGVVPNHVWLGVSAEGQKEADERIPKLLDTPAAIRFVSAEPLLERISLTKLGHDYHHIDALRGIERAFNSDGQCKEGSVSKLDWVIVGAESGEHRRDCGVDAIEYVVRQCVMAGVSVYCKQDVAFKSGQRGRIPIEVWQRKEFPR